MPYKMTFASADPEGALAFSLKYLGASETPQPHTGGNGRCALIKWCTFPGTKPTALGIDYQFHFVKGYHRPNGSMTIDEFEDQMAALHGDFSRADATYDQYMDFHVTLAADDLDVIAAKLVADGVPLLARKSPDGASASIFVEMPHAIVLEIVGPSLSVVTPVAWSRCGAPKRPLQVDVRKARRVVAASARDTSTHAGSHSGGYFGYASEYNFGDGSVHSGVNGGVNGGNGTVAAVRKSPVRPLRAVYASTVPKEAADFVAWAFAGERVRPQSFLDGGNDSCVDAQAVRWTSATSDSSYELVWIHSPKLPQGKLPLDKYEAYLRALHGNLSKNIYDEYMDNHVALIFGDGDDVVRRLDARGVPFFMRGQYGEGADIFVEGPGGQIYELLCLHQTLRSDIPTWNLCGPLLATDTPALA
uniref:Uncharacterized protein n=1 Tax=Chrysotila carterae TaxID=13221 RepID=A0A7S4BIP6_CHRCT